MSVPLSVSIKLPSRIMLKLFNTLTHRLEEFRPLEEGKVGLYSCGPTVYNFVHLGNLRAYLFIDLFKRYLAYRGYQVKHVMNITDVDDKTIRDSSRAGQTLKEFTEHYTALFLQDLEAVNIRLPDVMPKATEHINEMVTIVKKLLETGHAYRQGDSVYFKIATSGHYGELAQLAGRVLKENADQRLNQSDEYEKENVNDFVLWKGWKPEDGDVFWETEIGKGRPGWHIECTAMSMKYLGETFDVHGGGEDLVFPHHTNEIAQSEAYSGKKFVNYWLHNAHLLIEGKKMSKSLGNFFTLRDLVERGYLPILVRVVLLKVHYRQNLNFTFAGLDEAAAIARRFLDTLIDLEMKTGDGQNQIDVSALVSGCREKFVAAMDDDLNISIALAAVMDFLAEVNRQVKKLNAAQAVQIRDFIFELDQVLGFVRVINDDYQAKLARVSEDAQVRQLVAKRAELKKAKNYAAADEVRAQLAKKGITISDMPGDKYLLRINYP
jgi:cysteinyl-tRNA synthetase